MKNILRKSLISFFSLWGSIMILLFVIVFTSCSSTKKVEQTKVNESVATTVDSKTDHSKTESLQVTDITEKAIDKSLTQIENETTELETRITEYDTNKPIVAGTNKSPVKSETVTTNKKLAKKDTKYLDNSTEKSISDAVYTSQLEASIKLLISQNAKLIAENKNKETTSFPLWKYVSIVLGVILLVLLFDKFGVIPKLFVFVLKIFKVKS